MLTLNTNLSSLVAQTSLKTSTNKLNQAIERMTTGFKVNHASDNAANYSIITNMTTKINAYMVAEDNCAMGLDMLETAVSAIDIIQEHSERIRALCEQAANGTYGQQSLEAVQKEVNSLREEINRIVTTTEYNGKYLFNADIYKEKADDSASSQFLSDVIRLSSEQALEQGYTLVTNADEFITALQNSESICLMNDIDMSGKKWQQTTEVYSAVIEGNGYKLYNIDTSGGASGVGLLGFAGKNIVVRNLQVVSDGFDAYGVSGLFHSLSGENYIDNCVITGSCDAKYEFAGISDSLEADTTLSVKNTIIDFNNIGNSVSLVGNMAGFVRNIPASSSVSISNSFYNRDTISYTSGYERDYHSLSYSELRDLERGAIYNYKCIYTDTAIQVGINGDLDSQICFTTSLILPELSIYCRSAAAASAGLQTIDEFMNALSETSTNLAAVQNRLESALDEIGIQYDNLVSSRSTLRDADIAEVSATYIQQQILQQASATLLATANQSPALALQLL